MVNYQHQYVKCGKPSCSKCNKGRGHGPYWYAFWREGKKIKKRYIGKKFKALEGTTTLRIGGYRPTNEELEELKELGINLL